MSIPNWWTFFLLAAAAWRLYHLLAFDDILNPLRNRLVGLPSDAKSRTGGREKMMDFIECPFCLGFWTALAWWGAWQLWPHGTVVVAVPLALSAALIVVQRVASPE